LFGVLQIGLPELNQVIVELVIGAAKASFGKFSEPSSPFCCNCMAASQLGKSEIGLLTSLCSQQPLCY
jgi:hypothetical protein